MCSCFCTAEAIGLPYLQPFLSKQQPQNLSRGANFAIVGGTALDEGFFLRHNACSVPPFRSSLRVQIGWFRKLKHAFCNATATGSACRQVLRPGGRTSHLQRRRGTPYAFRYLHIYTFLWIASHPSRVRNNLSPGKMSSHMMVECEFLSCY
jgi:hypothetical protein